MSTITSANLPAVHSLCCARVPLVRSCVCLSSAPSYPSSSSLKKLSLPFSTRRRRIGGFDFRSKSTGGESTASLATIKCGGIMEINESQFSEVVLKSDRPVLVEFVATWCGPCRLIGPAMEWVSQEYKEKITVVKIDHDSNPRLIEEYKVYGLPTLILFKDGKEVADSRREGAITKVKLKDYLDGLLESVSVA